MTQTSPENYVACLTVDKKARLNVPVDLGHILSENPLVVRPFFFSTRACVTRNWKILLKFGLGSSAPN